ncbi:Helix-hairpin-helix domain-containing protein [Deinococcus saxicola]|uniref:ComEA family DNA-binding protein n=1 Tax=Deinococcus saxicola TaxID=249406 RepID=UPI0039F04787
MHRTLTILTTTLATAALLPTLAFAQTATPTTNTPAAMPTVKSAMNTVRTGMPSAASTMKMGKSSVTSKTTALIHINRVTARQLETLPGVSVKLAAEIIKDRPFKNSVDLEKKVKGIGAKNVKKMLPRISFT